MRTENVTEDAKLIEEGIYNTLADIVHTAVIASAAHSAMHDEEVEQYLEIAEVLRGKFSTLVIARGEYSDNKAFLSRMHTAVVAAVDAAKKVAADSVKAIPISYEPAIQLDPNANILLLDRIISQLKAESRSPEQKVN